MENFRKLLAIIFISSLLLTACSKDADDTNSKEDGDATNNETTEEVAGVENPPEGCPSQTTIVAKSPEAGTVEYDFEHSFYAQWQDEKWRGTLYFPSWDDYHPETNYNHDYVAGDAMVYFDVKTSDQTPITPGVWNYRAEEPNNSISWLNISTKDLSGGVFDDNAKVEITYFGDDYICGSVNADDGESSINGEFIATVYPYGY